RLLRHRSAYSIATRARVARRARPDGRGGDRAHLSRHGAHRECRRDRARREAAGGLRRRAVKVSQPNGRVALLNKPNVPFIAIEEHYSDSELIALFTGRDAAAPPHVLKALADT